MREGLKAMTVVKKEKSRKWIVAVPVKELNHLLVPIPANGCRSMFSISTMVSPRAKMKFVLSSQFNANAN